MSIERYGILIGRLWMRWPSFYWRDLWIGVYVKEPYWEGAEKRVNLYVCLVPMILFVFTWTLRPYPKISDYKGG